MPDFFAHMLALSVAVAVLGLSPGPAVFAIIGRSLALPLHRAFIFIAGILAGDLLFALLAMKKCGSFLRAGFS